MVSHLDRIRKALQPFGEPLSDPAGHADEMDDPDIFLHAPALEHRKRIVGSRKRSKIRKQRTGIGGAKPLLPHGIGDPPDALYGEESEIASEHGRLLP